MAEPLRQLSYEELKEYARENGLPMDDWGILEVEQDERTTEVNIMMADWGLIRRRVSVELNLNEIEEGRSWIRSCVYFERFKSGRLVEPKESGLLGTFVRILGTFLLVLIPVAAIVIALIYLISFSS